MDIKNKQEGVQGKVRPSLDDADLINGIERE